MFPHFALVVLAILFIDANNVASQSYSSNEFNPYQMLGVRRTATQKDIKQAYKRLAMEWHPDKNKRPEAEERFMAINQAYKILSSPQRRKAYDTFGMTEEQYEGMRREQFHREQQHFQYVRWPPPRRQQNDITTFLLPFASVMGTLLFIFLIGYLLNQMNMSEQAKRRRNNNKREAEDTPTPNRPSTQKQSKEQEKEWHPEDPKAPLTEEEKQARVQARVWRTMGPLIRELRAETQFGLIRLLKPGCRSIIVLVDNESKETLLKQFARHIYCLRNNKTFSFGYLMVPKNLNWFRSLLELTLPGDEQQPDDAASVSTATTDTDGSGEKATDHEHKDAEEKQKEKLEAEKKRRASMSAKNRLREINPKHTLGTVLVLCGWKLYFSICHPMHRPPSIRNRVALAELGDEEEEEECELRDKEDDEEGDSKQKRRIREHVAAARMSSSSLNVDNVLNGFPMFLDRLLEGTIRRYYVPEWPENLV